jgi:caffeoyl-CoA O-methyltransferase
MKTYESASLFLQKKVNMNNTTSPVENRRSPVDYDPALSGTYPFLEVDYYINDLFVTEDDTLKTATSAIRAAGILDASITSNQGFFLQLMARLVRANRILELGTFGGYSTIWLAKSLPKNGRLITMEFNPVHAALAATNIKAAGLDDRVEIRTGKALDLLPALQQESPEPFDMIFIDADKPPYTEYFQWALQFSRPGTLLIFDNVIREGLILAPNATDEAVKGVQRMNKEMAADPRVMATIIPSIGLKKFDGMAIAVVK